MYNDYYQDEDLDYSLNNFESSLAERKNQYFEVHEFEYIIDHYLSTSNAKAASTAVRKGLKIHPNSYDLLKRMAQVYNLEANFEAAYQTIQEAFFAFGTKEDVDYYMIIAESALGLGLTTEAHEHFSNAIDLSGEDYSDIVSSISAIYQQEGFIKEAADYLKLIADQHPQNLFDLAVLYFQALMFDEAKIYFEKFINTDYLNGEAWFYLGQCAAYGDSWASAENALLNSIALEPLNASYHRELARIYEHQEKYLPALESYKEILELSSELNDGVLIAIGNISFNMNLYESARKNYLLAIKVNPKNASAFHLLGLLEMTLEQFEEAEKQFTIAFDLNQDPEYLVSLANACFMNDKVELAEAHLNQALQIDTLFEMAWHQLFDVYFFTNRLGKAFRIADDAYQTLEQAPEFEIKKAIASYSLGHHRKAHLYLKQALSNEPDLVDFFLDYYPQANSNPEIMELIATFQHQNINE